MSLPTFDFKRRNLISGPHLLGSLLILAGMIALVGTSFVSLGGTMERNLVVGTAAILLGLLIVSTYGGTRIDFTANRYKDYWSIAGFKKGAWKTLPPILRVELVAIERMHTNQPNGISPTLSGKHLAFRVLVFSAAASPLLSFVYERRDKSLDQAQRLASGLNTELVVQLDQPS